MSLNKDRVKVTGTGGAINTAFTLSNPVLSFTSFPDGDVRYCVLSSTGVWQVALGTVAGSTLSRGSVESNSEGTQDQLDFSGLTIQIAQVTSAEYLNVITDKLETIEEGATGDLSSAEIKTLYEDNANTNEYSDGDKEKLEGIAYEATIDQQAIDVPYFPTAPDTSDNVQAAIDSVNIAISGHIQAATTITYDPTEDPVGDSTDVQLTLVDHGKGIEQRVSSNSGILTGGRLSAGIGSTVFEVSAGTGIFTDSHTNPLNTSIIEQSWDTFSGHSIEPEASSLSVVNLSIFIYSSGGNASIVKVAGVPSLSMFRDHIFLGNVKILDGAIVSASAAPAVAKQTGTDVSDILRTVSTLTGGELLSVEGSLSVWMRGGTLFFPGVNWFGNSSNPNLVSFSASSPDNSPAPRNPIIFSSIDRVGNLIFNNSLSIIPESYDNAGVITTLPNSKAVIHRMHILGCGEGQRKYVLQYGQNIYDSAEEAKNNLLTDAIVEPAEIDSMSFLGYVCITKGVTSFDDGTKAWIVSGEGGQVTSSAVQTGNHASLTNLTIPDQHPIEAIGDGTVEGQLVAQLASKTEYKGDAVTDGFYDVNSMVTSGSYLSQVINPLGTSEPPVPTFIGDAYKVWDGIEDLVGDPILPPAFTQVAGGTNVIRSGNLYRTVTSAFIQQLLVIAPEEPSADTNFKAVLIVDPYGATPKSEVFPNIVLSTSEWTIIKSGNTFVPAGTEFLFYIESHSTAGSVLTTSDYTYLKTGNGNPSTGQLIRDNGGTVLKISKVDRLGTDRSGLLASLDINDTIRVTVDGDVSAWELFNIQGVGTDSGAWYEFPIIISNVGTGNIPDNSDVITNIDNYTDGDTKYLEDANYITGTNAEGLISGYLNIGGVDQAVTPNAYGVDVKIQKSNMSSDWKILASSAAGSTDTGGGTTLISWGNILGTLSNQNDLQIALNNKANGPILGGAVDVNTSVPVGALFTDTTYSVGNGGLTEVNFTSAKDGIVTAASAHLDGAKFYEEHIPPINNVGSDNNKVLVAGSVVGSASWKTSPVSTVVSITPPTSPYEGQNWLNSNIGSLYTWYSFGSGQWILSND